MERIPDLKGWLAKKSHFLFGPRQTGKTFLVGQVLRRARRYDLLDSSVYIAQSQRPSRHVLRDHRLHEEFLGPRFLVAGRAETRFAMIVACTVLLAAAFLVRILCALGELWFDEVYFVLRCLAADGPWRGIFASPVGNHHLYNLWLYVVGDTDAWMLYRFPSLVLGTGAAGLAALWMMPSGRRGALLGLVVFGFSFPMILYSTEARGYVPAVFFSLVSLLLARAFARAPSAATGVWLSLALATSLLWQVTAVQPVFAVACWLVFVEVRRRGRILPSLVVVSAILAPATLSLAFVYLADLRGLELDAPGTFTLASAAGDILSLQAGGGLEGSTRLLGIGASLSAGALGIVLLARERADRLIPLVAGSLLAPALLVARDPGSVWFARYFLVASAFWLLLFCEALASAIGGTSRRGLAAAIAAVVLGAYLAGNALQARALSMSGKGGYFATFRSIAARSKAARVTVGGDNDLRSRVMIHFYKRYLPPEKIIVYLTPAEWPPDGPDWFLLNPEHIESAPARLEVLGRSFRLDDAIVPYPLVGWPIALYRNANTR